MLYQDLIRDNKLTPDGRLPPVLPVVLYSGDDGWTAATEISELIESVPGGLERYRPQMRYLLVEERGYFESDSGRKRKKRRASPKFSYNCWRANLEPSTRKPSAGLPKPIAHNFSTRPNGS